MPSERALAAGVAHLVHLHAAAPSLAPWLAAALSSQGTGGLAGALQTATDAGGLREAIPVLDALERLLSPATDAGKAVRQLVRCYHRPEGQPGQEARIALGRLLAQHADAWSIVLEVDQDA